MEYILRLVFNEHQTALWRYKYELYAISLVDFLHQIAFGCFMCFIL